ncbi:uncharacterized protein EI90DRAFT_3030710 [Cantharellus anzutake]|uniref:uncharacterized protein n=1 Tax=Cantharellus anzutake TaxID=1750568 RepID=UPI0019074A06|nr:uncharacterized protein EI90DRAFT_3030710 [Cantharellus anzutake]KAF8342926.1 hypothetical protein EI90DRAFT_3030710 [Cantharellus anzutake]
MIIALCWPITVIILMPAAAPPPPMTSWFGDRWPYCRKAPFSRAPKRTTFRNAAAGIPGRVLLVTAIWQGVGPRDQGNYFYCFGCWGSSPPLPQHV